MAKRSIGVVSLTAMRKKAANEILIHTQDPDHHAWVIDQMCRLVFGNAYDRMIELYETELGRTWDCGEPPR